MANVVQQISIQTSQQITPTGYPGNVSPLSQSQSFSFNPGNGTAADQVNELSVQTVSFAASPVTIDLTTLVDPLGATWSAARIDSIIINQRSVTDGQVLLMGYTTTTTNAWTSLISNPGQMTLQPATAANKGMLLVTAPNTTGYVVSATNKLLHLDPGANTFLADIIITGRTV
jgi:hypothetical protein